MGSNLGTGLRGRRGAVGVVALETAVDVADEEVGPVEGVEA